MPFYRIKIWTKLQQKPFEGIRHVENTFVDNVFRMYESNARQKYGRNFIDLEVQQLSKLCTAVNAYLTKAEQIKKQDGLKP